MTTKKNKIDFEKSLKELEELVEKMEAGNLSLEDSLKYFEKGVALTKSCQQALTEAEHKVRILMDQGKDKELHSFDPADKNNQ